MRDEPLTITADPEKDGVTVLHLVGPLTLPNIFAFQNEVAKYQPQLLIVELSESPYMDSAGLGSLMNAYIHAKKSGHTLVLAGANMRVNALLEMTKVQLILKNYATVQEAESSARA